MDRREETQHEANEYQKELAQQSSLDEKELEKQYIEIDGTKFRVPYRIIKKVVFSNISQQEMRDMDHAARIQYRLMLNDAVLKATVNFVKQTISVVYNHKEADNLKDKVSRQDLIDMLAKEGVHIDPHAVEERDYDYVKEFYTYAFHPTRIREHAPYSYTIEQWRKMKPQWEAKQAEFEAKKLEAHRKFQEEYDKTVWHPEKGAAEAKAAEPTLLDKILGRKPKPKETKQKDKGFWFHGV